MSENDLQMASSVRRSDFPALVLHVIVDLRTGGAELMLQRLALTHRDSPDFRHTVISLRSLGTIGPHLQAAGISVEALGLNSALHAPMTVIRLARRIRQLRPAILQCWMYHADLLGGLAALIGGTRRPPVIWGVRIADIRPEFGVARATGWVRRACAALSRSVPDRIIYVAREARRVHEAIGYDPAKGEVIPNGFVLPDAPQDRTLREELELAVDALVIGSAGRFNRQKDHAGFIRAAGQVAKRFPQARFVMCGDGVDPANQELANLITATGFADRFHLLGRRSDMDRFMGALDVFCLHSLTEGFPNVVGEAMAAGVACVVTDVGDAAYLVGETGTVVPRRDHVALAAALDAMLRLDVAERAAVGGRAQSRIRQHFSMPAIVSRYEEVYRELAPISRCWAA